MVGKKRTTRRIISANAIALLTAAILATGAAIAHGAELAVPVVEEVIVTGSRLARRDFTAPSPLATIDRDTLLRSGQATLEEALNKLPQLQPSFGRASNNPGDGTSTVDLRGIGASRSLVMLNGRRIAPAGVSSTVDVNTLPGVLIDRIEVVTGGATTVYGSDAIAGVVNFITRDDFDGLGLETSYYTTGRGDSDIADVNLTWGRNFGGGNLTLFGGYLERESTTYAERDFSSRTLSDNWLTGRLGPGGSPTTPAGVMSFPSVDFGNGLVRATWDANGNPRPFVRPDDLYDFAPLNYLQVPLERFSGGALLKHTVADGAELYAEAMVTKNKSGQRLAPAGTFFALVEVNTDNPLLTAANRQMLSDFAIPRGPDRLGFALSRRLVELGPRIVARENDVTRLLAGLRGELTGTWAYDAWVSYTKGEDARLERNDASFSRLQQGLLVDPSTGACFDPSGGCVPLNLFGEGNLSPEGAEFIRARPYLTTVTREQALASAYIRGDPFSLPAGPVSTAIGIEWRRDSGRLTADEALFTGDALGFRADSNVDGDELVAELYAETLLPVLSDRPMARHLGVEFGGRWSRYDHAGDLGTWKLGADWEPVDGIRLRTMFQRSARAPNLGEAFQVPYEEATSVVFMDPREDPCSASADPVGSGLRDVCIAQGIPADLVGVFEASILAPVKVTLGGNPDLAPEIGETFTAGVVLSTTDRWTLAVDYFEIDVEDTIGESDPMFVCYDPANARRVTCNRIRRDSPTFDIDAVDRTNATLGRLRTRGIDTQLGFGTELSGWAAIGAGFADLGVSVVWTHVIENSVQADPASTVLECVGKFGAACHFFGNDTVFPGNRVTTNFTWSAGAWRAALAWQWIEGTDNSARDVAQAFGLPVESVMPAIGSIGSRSYLDVSVSRDVTPNLHIDLTIANLLDKDPPLIADNGGQANTDTEMFDVFGRAFTLRLALDF